MALPLHSMTIHLPLDNHIDMPSIHNGNLNSNGARSTKGVNVTNGGALLGNGLMPPVGLATPPYHPNDDPAKPSFLGDKSPTGPFLSFKSTDGSLDANTSVGMAYAKGVPIYAHVLAGHLPWSLQGKTGQIVRVDELLSPIAPHHAGTVRAIGLSYVDHARELKQPLPSAPSVFFKPPTTIADPGEDIPVPLCAQHDEVDYEVELAVVLGRDCKNVSPDEALDFVLGWTCANDLTARRVQETSSQWGYSKGFDKFLPLGPCLVSSSALPDPRDVVLETRLNGELVQNGSARNMIWHVSELISHLSQGTTLPAGTVIITGTPPGIGASRGVWLRDGDEVRCSISGGIGSLVNRIVYQA